MEEEKFLFEFCPIESIGGAERSWVKIGEWSGLQL